MFELTVPFETNINSAHERKVSEYLTLQADIIQNGYTCFLSCVEIGARGLVTSEIMARTNKLSNSSAQKLQSGTHNTWSRIPLKLPDCNLDILFFLNRFTLKVQLMYPMQFFLHPNALVIQEHELIKINHVNLFRISNVIRLTVTSSYTWSIKDSQD